MSKIKFVKQKDKGCAVACLAMVLGKTYEQIEADFRNDFKEQGLTSEDIMDYLSDFGCKIIRKQVEYYGTDVKFGREELLKPFAPAHIVSLKPKFDSEARHAVVMDAEGKLFCPSGQTDEQVRGKYKIVSVFGIYK